MSNKKFEPIKLPPVRRAGLSLPRFQQLCSVVRRKCYVHKEGSSSLVEFELKTLPVSPTLYGKSGDICTLLKESCSDPTKKWVCLPAYAKNTGNAVTITDYQLAVTGSVSSTDRTFAETSIRECAEEIGVKLSADECVSTKKLACYKKAEGFVYDVASVESPTSSDMSAEKGTDDASKKSVAWVLFDNPTDIITRKRISTSTDVAGEYCVVMQVDCLISLVELLFP